MNEQELKELFEERKVHTVWDNEQEKWYFPELAKGWGQIVTPLSVQTTGGNRGE